MSDVDPTAEPVEAAADARVWPPPFEVEKNIAELVRASQPRTYAAPRRFDLPTIFAVTTAYCMLFAVMGALEWPAVAVGWVAGFITLTALSQALLFRGQRPRLASILAGATILSLTLLFIWLFNGARRYSDPALFVALAFSISLGALVGYLAGTTVGGVFLVADVLRGRFGRRDNVDGP